MVIVEKGKKQGVTDYNVRFEERDISDILTLDDGQEDEADFPAVAAVSEMNDRLYQAFVGPWVRMSVTEPFARLMRQLHPLRVTRYAFSDRNPFLLPLKTLVPIVKENRRPVPDDNLFLTMEKSFSVGMETMLNCYRDIRDDTQEFLFKCIYRNPWMKVLFSGAQTEEIRQPAAVAKKREGESDPSERKRWLSAMEKGGFAQGIIRIMVAMAGADHIIDRREFVVSEKIVKANDKLRKLKPSDFRQMVKEQSRILETDKERALASLPKLLPSNDERIEAFEIARNIADADFIMAEEEAVLLEKIKRELRGKV